MQGSVCSRQLLRNPRQRHRWGTHSSTAAQTSSTTDPHLERLTRAPRGWLGPGRPGRTRRRWGGPRKTAGVVPAGEAEAWPLAAAGTPPLPASTKHAAALAAQPALCYIPTFPIPAPNNNRLPHRVCAPVVGAHQRFHSLKVSHRRLVAPENFRPAAGAGGQAP